MALTEIKTSGIADDAVTTDKLANAINTERTANTAKPSLANDANNRVVTGDGSGGLNGEANLNFDGTSLGVNQSSFATTDTVLSVTKSDAHCEVGLISKNDSSALINFGDTDSYNQGRIKYDNSDSSLTFRTSGTDKLSISTGGNVTISDGDLVVGTAGHGIDFSATSHAAGMSSELLDSYEEGTWSPTYTNVSAPNYNNNTGKYTRIGRYVYCDGIINITDGSLDTSDASTVAISSLPFAGNATHESCLFTLGRYLTVLPQAAIDGYTNARFTGTAVLLHEGSADGIRYSNCNSSGILQFSFAYQI